MNNNSAIKMKRKIGQSTLLIIACLVLGLLTTYTYVTYSYVSRYGIQYLETGDQIQRQQAVLEGHAGNPWQYRVFAVYLVRMVFNLFKVFQIPHYIAVSFIFVRVIQDTIILILSFLYLKEFRLSTPLALSGLVLIAWGMSSSYHDSDLSFNTFFDIIFYLLAGLSILKKRVFWILPITVFTALNRETSGLIPFLLLAVVVESDWNRLTLKKVAPIFVFALISYIAIYIGLRIAYVKQEVIVPWSLDLLRTNLFGSETWIMMIWTLNVIPLLALAGYRKFPVQLKVFFWVIVPIWFIVHAFGAIMAETRLLLVPQIMVFIPGALYLVKYILGPTTTFL